MRFIAGFAGILLLCVSCLSAPPDTRPDARAEGAGTKTDQAALEKELRIETAALPGERQFQGGVLTITLPRSDLWVQADLMEIPTAAGLASNLYFYRCDCGKDHIVGQFALTDFEVNDVVDALRAGHIEIAAIAPMFIGDNKPRMMLVRFQAEGQAADFAKTIQSALEWVGEARSAKRPIGQDQP